MEAVRWALASWLFAASSVALWSVIRPRRQVASSAPRGSLLLVRPCAGHEPTLARALASTSEVLTQARLIVRFAVAAMSDPAEPIAAAVAADLRTRGIDARVVITGASAPNLKADQLAHVLADEGGEIVIIADSDVDLTGTDLDALVAPLARSAASWAPPIEVEPRTLGDRASAAVLDASMHAFALLGTLDDGGMVGKLVALRRAELDDIGGFAGLRRHLGEDMELARRLRAAGHAIERSPVPSRSLAGGRSLGEAAARYARWLGVIRAQRAPLLLTYPLVLAPFPALLVLAAVASSNGGAVFAVLAVGYRLGVAWAARVRSGSPRRTSLVVDALLADLLLWAALFRALASTNIVWRGTKLKILPGGEIGRKHDLSV